ncbi:MAG TPA: molybdopterin synthase sulfur carrier subunit [Deltaproteobacteria bacterium]|nr:MAG: molybdopterin synthase sulfur carrier subunit [Deltaproteobacteria bacterium GWA2_45_12]HBF12680.1 molybdopterin synthase sulfur carrier subunit [Deltaproteobacteria bacterium]
MSIKVRIPTPLQTLTNNQGEILAEGKSVSEVLAHLDKTYPGLKQRFYDDAGSLRRFINFYVNDEDIRFLQGEKTALKDGDELSVVPAIAGGK